MKNILPLLWCFLCLPHFLFGSQIPQYNGHAIDLATYPATTLYKVNESKLVANQLSVKGIFEYASQESTMWRLEVPFVTSSKTINQRDIWLQLRSNVVAANVFINDQLLFKNGKLGRNIDDEKAGKSLLRRHIPRDLLQPGQNIVKIEFTNYRHQQGAIFRDISIGPLDAFQRHAQIMSTAPLVLAGIFLFAIIVNSGFYIALGRLPLFAAQITLFSLGFVLMLNEVLYWNGLASTISLVDKVTLTRLLEYSIFGCLLLTLYLHFKFNSKHLPRWVFAFSVLSIIAYLLSIHPPLMLSALLLTLCVIAIKYKANDSLAMFIFALFYTLVLIIDQSNILDNLPWVLSNLIITSFVFKIDNLALAILALLMIVISSRRILRNTEALHNTKLQLQQLEFQFVQKHIQPHFLMNTLMSLQQLIKKDQTLAGEMIEALSEEFYLMTRMIKQVAVPIEQELQMCHNYLTIMSLQHKAHFSLKTHNISGEETIPPAVFHTLIENGITHGYKNSRTLEFSLIKDVSNHKIRYILTNNGAQTSSKSSTGSGLHYIESRLQQWWPNTSNVLSESTRDGWQTIIELSQQPTLVKSVK